MSVGAHAQITPPQPDPLADKALAVLERHCARCHQQGKLTREKPAGNFGNILHLRELARESRLVRPGNADASRLWTHMMRRVMPYDVFHDRNGGAEPDADEILAVRAWIEHLPYTPRRKASVPEGDEAAVSVIPDRLTYRPGDAVVFRVTSTVDCRLTLVSIDVKGRGTVIVPNDLETDDRLVAGRERVVPAAEAGYLLRAKESGRERVVALCNRGKGRADGIRHDFERQRFTELGDYTQFLARAIGEETASRQAMAEQPREVIVRKRRKRRVRARRPSPPPEPFAAAPDVLRSGAIFDVR